MIDALKLWFIQEFLPEIDLNNYKTVEDLFGLSKTIGEGDLDLHRKLSDAYMEKIAKLYKKHGKGFNDVLDTCLDHEKKKVAELFEEVAFFKAVALTVHWEFEGYKAFIKSRGLKPPPPEQRKKLHLIKK